MHQHFKNHQKETQLFTRRTLALSIVMLLLSLALISRLFYLQIHEHSRFTTLSDKNTFNLVPISPMRGLIYDRNGVLLAENIAIFSLEIVPSQTKNLKNTIADLKKLIPITDEEIGEFYKQTKQRHVHDAIPLRLKLNEEERAIIAVNQYYLPGVQVNARLIRSYPYNKLYAHTIGYVGRINEKELKEIDQVNYSASNFMGKVGIEKSYEDLLHGTVGYEQVEMDARGRTIRTVSRKPPIAGKSIYLTIDSRLQAAASKIMENHYGAAVAIDPKNGEVLAMVSSPSYDPNLFVKGINTEDYKALRDAPERPLYNRILQGQYPFGSTIKPFLAIGALNDNVIDPKHRIHDPGWFTLPGSSHRYRDWTLKKTGHGHGIVDMDRAITVSCDVYFYNLAVLAGINRMHNNLRKFNLGRRTGIDLPLETPGLIGNPRWKYHANGDKWYLGDTVSAGIGQGYMLTTPLQLANAVSIIATRGTRLRPHLLLAEQLGDEAKVLHPVESLDPLQLNDEKSWDIVIDAMHNVIANNEGTARRYGLGASYTIAGKTGTAQVIALDKQTQLAKSKKLAQSLHDHSLFIAFAPVEDPKIALAVLIENKTIYAAAVARQIFDFYLTGKAPEEVTTPEKKI